MQRVTKTNSVLNTSSAQPTTVEARQRGGAVLHCAVLHCAVLHCAVLRCAALRCAVVHCAVAALLTASACASSDSAEPAAQNSGTGAVYALVSLVWSDDGPIGYVALVDDLDVTEVSLDSAREFTGYTSIAALDGALLVNPSWEDLSIKRYRISDDLKWQADGALGFAEQGAEAVSFQTQYMQQGHTAYLDVDVTGRVIWDPLEFAIEGVQTDMALELIQDGLDLYANLNRTQAMFSGAIIRPFSYHDLDWFRYSPDTYLVVYDPKSHAVTDVITAPCPALDSITQDEVGNTYLGTQEYSALQPLMGSGPAPCTVRLTPDKQLDSSWNSDLTQQTEGRQVVNFRYIGGGKAIAAVLHAEEYGEDFDFPALVDDIDSFWDTSARNHRLWLFDLDNASAAPVSGIDFDFINPGFFHAVLDGRTFVFLGDGNNGDNNFNQTLIYELDEQGAARRHLDVQGSVLQWIRVR